MFKSIPGIKIISFFPGRVKLKLETLVGQEDLARRASAELSQARAIKKVLVDPLKGHVLINYDRKRIAEPESLDELTGVLSGLFPDLDWDALRKRLE